MRELVDRSEGPALAAGLALLASLLTATSLWAVTSSDLVGWATTLILAPPAAASGLALALTGAAVLVRPSYSRLLTATLWSLAIGLSWFVALGT